MSDAPNRAILRDYFSVMHDAPADASIWDVDPEAGERILDALAAMWEDDDANPDSPVDPGEEQPEGFPNPGAGFCGGLGRL